MDMPEFKERFIERYSKLTEFDLFKDYSLRYLRRSIRVNTLKTTVPDIKKRLEKNWILTPIPWCKEGFWLEHKEGRKDVGNLKEHVLGYVFIQEAASMIPPIVLDPKPGECILDMAASPGSKATQIAQYMENKGVLVANDYKLDRIKSLGLNMQRMGVNNNLITMMEGRFFKGLQFDRILLDAHCSGTGTIRKSLKTIRIWNPNMIRRLAGTQKQLLKTAFSNLKPGGTLVYSTCSLEPEEDEAIISNFIQEHSDCRLENIQLAGLKKAEPVTEFEGTRYDPEVKRCLRIWPQDNDTEGFFVAKIKKSEA